MYISAEYLYLSLRFCGLPHTVRISECQAITIRCIRGFCTGCSDFVFVFVAVVPTLHAINDDDVDELSSRNMEI